MTTAIARPDDAPPRLPGEPEGDREGDAAPRRGRAARRFARNPMAMAGLAFLLLVVILAVFAPWIAPKDPNHQDLLARLQSPNGDALLGTDDFGRDQLSRLVYGSRVSLLVGIGAMAIALGIGVPTGLAAGFVGGKVDTLFSRFNDALLALPALLFFFAIIAVFGPSLPTLCVAIGTVASTAFFRITRSSTQAVAQETYIEASRALGARTSRILLNHILPNILSPLLVRVSLGAGAAVTAEASLSFLGLGVAPPTATWGGMLSSGNSVIQEAAFLVYAPGAMIALTVLSYGFIGDGLRSAMGTTRSAVAERA